jgi:hypothetical protein
MREGDEQIADILGRYGEAFASSVWRVQGQAVIFHKALERIAARAGIRFDKPVIIRAEREEAVLLVTGLLGDKMEWSIGEALINVNYRVSGKQAAYVYAMAEKRAKDRVILKLIGLHGLLYSEEEADEFSSSQPAPAESAAPPPKPVFKLTDAGADKIAALKDRAREKRKEGREAWTQWWSELTERQREIVMGMKVELMKLDADLRDGAA